MSNISKPQERKEHKELSSAPVADASSGIITVPVVNYKIDAKTQALLEENFVLQEERKEIKTAGNKTIINRKKKEIIEEFYDQLMAAIKSLKETLDGSATHKATPDSLRKLLEGRSEASEKDRDLDECSVCLEKFSTYSSGHQYYPYINSEGYTLTLDCSKDPTNADIDPVNRQELVSIQYGDLRPHYVPNHDLVDVIKNRPVFVKKVEKFAKRFVAVAASLLSGKAQPVAEEKSSHTTTTSSSSSVQAVAIPDPKDIDPEMMIFLLEMGISWEFFPLPSFLTVVEKLSPLTRRRCFTEPTKNNSIFVYEACVGKYSKKFSKMVFDVAKQCVNAPDEAGRTALMQAAAVGDIAGAEVLLYLGANIDAVDNAGGTVLHALALRNEIAFEKRLPFLRQLKEKLESGEAKKSQQESQVDKWRSFVDLPNKAGLTPLLLGVMNKNTGFLKDLINFEEIFLLVLEQMEDFGKDKGCAEQVEILKQDTLEFAATRANAFAEGSKDFARYMGYVKSLTEQVKQGVRISEDFVKKLPEGGGVKNLLQARLDARSKKRDKNKNKRKKEGESKQTQSSSSTVLADIDVEIFRPMLIRLKDLSDLTVSSERFGVTDEVLQGVGEKCMELSVNEQKQYSRLRQARALSAAIDAISEMYKGDSNVRNIILKHFSDIVLGLLSKKSVQTKQAAVKIFRDRFDSECRDIFERDLVNQVGYGVAYQDSFKKDKAQSSSSQGYSQKSYPVNQQSNQSMSQSHMTFFSRLLSSCLDPAEFSKNPPPEMPKETKDMLEELFQSECLDNAEFNKDSPPELPKETKGMLKEFIHSGNERTQANFEREFEKITRKLQMTPRNMEEIETRIDNLLSGIRRCQDSFSRADSMGVGEYILDDLRKLKDLEERVSKLRSACGSPSVSKEVKASSSSAVSDINAKSFKPMLEVLKRSLDLGASRIKDGLNMMNGALEQIGRKCLELAVNERGQYSRSRQTYVLKVAIDAMFKLYGERPVEQREACLSKFGKIFLPLLSDKSDQIKEEAREAILARFTNEKDKEYFARPRISNGINNTLLSFLSSQKSSPDIIKADAKNSNALTAPSKECIGKLKAIDINGGFEAIKDSLNGCFAACTSRWFTLRETKKDEEVESFSQQICLVTEGLRQGINNRSGLSGKEKEQLIKYLTDLEGNMKLDSIAEKMANLLC